MGKMPTYKSTGPCRKAGLKKMVKKQRKNKSSGKKKGYK